ncbi:MAG: FliA/WhiG family RNA polymerase sigma factor [Defluviitaleaceae bacterium]|nr:FliA/WhiG family RNA polymerase sigma factor [Defluviitaleaceae bacterium]
MINILKPKSSEQKPDIDKIWDAFSKNRDAAAKEQLILHYSPMIKYVVGRMSIYVGNAIDFDDLVSYGIFGLIDAIDKFDYHKGAKFETYAGLRIRGAVLDGLRSLDWVPRSLRQKSRQLDEAYTALEAELGREPTNIELAERLGVPVDEMDEEIKKSSLMALISLDDYLEGNHETAASLPADDATQTPENLYEHKELKQMLIDALEKLTEKERLVTALYYFDEMTLKEISKIMEVSESRVSQIHSKAMLKLRARLGRYKSVLFA